MQENWIVDNCVAVKRVIEEWEGLKRIKVNEDATWLGVLHFSVSTLYPYYGAFTFSTLISTSVVADYLHYEAPVNPLSLQDREGGAKIKMRNVKNNMWARCYVQVWLGSLVN